MKMPRTLTVQAADGPIEVVVRPFAEGDSITELTTFLHRAYRRLADMGLQFLATHQTEEQTRERLHDALCLLALSEGTVVGTISYYGPDRSSDTEWYDRPDVACFGQFGVEPALRGNGLGAALLAIVEELALEEGAAELALDTAETAYHLIEYYGRRGYRLVGHAQWNVTNYRSVLMSKALSPAQRSAVEGASDEGIIH